LQDTRLSSKFEITLLYFPKKKQFNQPASQPVAATNLIMAAASEMEINPEDLRDD
jgi:hypothetical protein